MLSSEGDSEPQVSSFTPGHIFGSYHRTLKFGTGICLLPKEGRGWEREERGAEWAEVNCGCSRQVGGVSAFILSHPPFAAYLFSRTGILEAWPVALCHWQWLSVIGNATPWPHTHLLKLNPHFNLKV